ncbi:odorant receptor 67d isoform X2 [Musca autumnalis]|uniref:odorant receptor 67d isoform X2 n=1 Tax=Musca autumnalis TaxID=221902 RepID=UPI003CE88991
MPASVVQRYEMFVRVVKLCCGICGANVFKPDYRMNILTWIVIFFINLYFAFTGYTLYVNIYVEKDWAHILQVLCFLGSALQGYCKLFNVIWNKEHFRYMIDELRLIYTKYSDEHMEYDTCLQKSIKSADKFIKFMAIMHVVVSMCLIGIVPFYRVVFDQRIFVMHCLFPGVDPNTEYGYLITNAMHSICIVFGAFGNFAADLMFFIFVRHFPLFKDILKCKFHDLNEVILGDEEQMRSCNILLKDIIQWHQNYMRYVTSVKDTYFWVIIVELATVALSIGSTLFCLIMGMWPGGQTYLVYCFMMLYMYCGLGTVVEVTFSFCYESTNAQNLGGNFL